jgi:outer membrane protein, adhesin transport system
MMQFRKKIKISVITAFLICNISIANGEEQVSTIEAKAQVPQKALDIYKPLDDSKGLNIISGEKTGQIGIASSPIISVKPKKVFSQEIDGDIDEYIKVSLFDVVLEAVANSHNIKAAREKVRQAQLNLDEAYSGYKPTLDAEYRYGKTHKSPGDEDEDDPDKRFTDETLKFQIKQNIYSGGATINKIKGLEKSLEVANNRYELALNQEIQNAIKAYLGVVFSSNALSVTKANMEMLNKILEIVTIKYDLGAASIGDISSIKASVANAETRFSKTKSKFVESLKYYEYIVGENFKYTLPYEYEFETPIEPLENLIALAHTQNLNIVSFLINIEAEKFKLKSAESSFRPKIDLELNTTRTYNKDVEPEDFYKQNSNEAFITFKYNLYNGGRDANKMKSVYSTIREFTYKVEEEKRKVKWIVSNLFQSLKALESSISSTKNEVDSSKVTVDSYWEAFKNGEQDLQTLLTSQRQLNTAEVSLIEFHENKLNDFFKLLLETGRLIDYFDLSPYEDKFIDFSKSGYNNNYFERIEKKASQIASAEVSASLSEKEVVKEIEIVDSIDDILVFKDKFLDANDDDFTIFVSDFETIYDAFGYMKQNSLSKQAFIVDVLKDYKLRSIMAYGIYGTNEEANSALSQIEQTQSKTYEIVTIDKIKDLYRKFINGFDELKPKAIVQTKTIKMAPKPPKAYVSDSRFKQEFVNASGDYYTINLVTFANLDDAIDLVDKEDIYDSSLTFRYGPNGEWLKVVYGVFSRYEDAHIALSLLSQDIKERYHPIVEHIRHQQELYSKYKDLPLGTPTKSKGAVEYMTVSENTVVETKEIEFDETTQKSILVDIPKDSKVNQELLNIDLTQKPKVAMPKEVIEPKKEVETVIEKPIETLVQQPETKQEDVLVEEVDVQSEQLIEEVKAEESIAIQSEVSNVEEVVKIENTIEAEEIKVVEFKENVVIAQEVVSEVANIEVTQQEEISQEIEAREELASQIEEIVTEKEIEEVVIVENIRKVEEFETPEDFQEEIVEQNKPTQATNIGQNIDFSKEVKEVYFEDLKKDTSDIINSTIKYQIDINTLKQSDIKWFAQRYKIVDYSTMDLGNGLVKVYIGDFDSKEKAMEVFNSLHPYVNSISKIIEFSSDKE